MYPNLFVLLLLSMAIAGNAAIVAFLSGWGVFGALLVYSIGGSTTLLLLASLAAGLQFWTLNRGPDQTG